MGTPVKRAIEGRLRKLAEQYPVVTLTGPRQSGKTTLCRMAFSGIPYANLENPEIRQFASVDPRGFLAQYPHGAVLDEFHRVPELASYIQVLVDEPGFAGVFVLTGSRNLSVRDTVSQSLAGRTALLELLPFSHAEACECSGAPSVEELIFRGLYPRIHDRQLDPTQALADYVGTYIERDLRQLSMIRDLTLFQKFLGLCAGRVGSLLNLEGLGNDTGVTQPTARAWLSLLEASYITFQLPPFFRNISKRLVKSPKLYFHDVGLATYLLGITGVEQIRNHPLRGMLFENLIVTEILKFFTNRGPKPRLLFYRDSNGNEVDILIPRGQRLIPIEVKAAATISSDFFKGLARFADAISDTSDPMLVYSGPDTRVQQGVRILNVAGLENALLEVTGG